MADKSIEEKFVIVVKHQIKAIITMIDNARDEGLTETTSEGVVVILNLVDALDKDGKQAQLVKMFITKSEYWDIVEARNLNKIRDALPKMFESLPVDRKGLSVPIDVYLALKAKPANKQVPVINDKHMTALWENLDKLIKASVIYDSENGGALKETHKLHKWYAKYNIGN